MDFADVQTLVPGYVSPFYREADINLQNLDQEPTTPIPSTSGHSNSFPPLVNVSNRPSISFIIRPASGLTGRVYSRLIEQKNAINIPVLVEGPYGGMSKAVEEADEIVAFAGGIGITTILGYLTAYIASFPKSPGREMRATKLKIFWSVRESSLVEVFKSHLPPDVLLTERNVDITIVCKEMGDRRLNCEDILDRELSGKETIKRLAVLVCGPGKMADEIRAIVAEFRGYNYIKVSLVEESFGW
jgi:predicted ferric reductase